MMKSGRCSERIWEFQRHMLATLCNDAVFKVSYLLKTEYIKWMNVPDRITSTNIKNDDWPYILGSLDATVQRINKPSKNQNGKHKCKFNKFAS